MAQNLLSLRKIMTARKIHFNEVYTNYIMKISREVILNYFCSIRNTRHFWIFDIDFRQIGGV